MTILEFNAIRLVALLGMALVACPSHAVLIDDFSDGAVSLRREVGEPRITDMQTGLSAESVVGGSRETTLRAIDRAGGSTGGVSVVVDINAEKFIYDADPGISSVNHLVRYGSEDDPLHADFAAGGADRFRFEFESASFSTPAIFNISVVTAASSSMGNWNFFEDVSIPDDRSPFFLDVPFDGFQEGQPFAPDFSDVWSFQLGTAEGHLVGDFTLTAIRTIPEPASIALLGMGVIALRLTLRLRC